MRDISTQITAGERSNAYLGTGWGFPPTFDRASKGVKLVNAEDDIRQSLEILLSTNLGERVMQPTYGCNLHDLLFETFSPTVASSIKEIIRIAILYHEPRILINQLDLHMDAQIAGVIYITVDYTIISTNSRFNFVYPFYLQEASGNLLAVPPETAEFPVPQNLSAIAEPSR
ncbi:MULTISPECIES: GPW/gp25 family protein [Calothrix]|uniref:GPW/gp25 family protein n=2 Tax=Calothrix TaxID=1186 RepID=A0ABR8AL83_9CYAN|nr:MULTISPECIES: GPW/gp25 family protein [Calothrix]MBD2199391.1 GPW/gp25 family protein [Calothrix parietina FACHB-288]MBD2228069.1 GPW/gp25 family protein [Calothrix anomala FACHB-343]